MKRDGSWRISRTSYRRTYEEVWQRSGPGPQHLTATWWGTDGVSQLPMPEHVAALARGGRKD